MGTTSQTLVEQLRITKHEIARRKEYLDFTEEDCGRLVAVRPIVAEHIDAIVEEFYRRILPFSEMDRIIGDAETLHKLKNHQRQYILSLFDGQYDEEYVHSRLRVGVVHKRIGVSPKYYLAAVHNLTVTLRIILARSQAADCEGCLACFASLEKILTFDLALVVDTYIHSLMDEVQRSREDLEHYTQSLEEVIAERTRHLKEQARLDGLTGLLNQQHFFTELRRELSRGQRRGYPTALLYFDLDGFKQVNDSQGHNMGDRILATVAETLKKTIRENELAARYGGDEFCIIMPESGTQEAFALAGRICDELAVSLANTGVTCSMGVASSTPEAFIDANTLVQRADQAMYIAKKKIGFAIHAADPGT